ncbi:MAG TPA: vWA domain-containing protein [Polyangia bacterium]|jgi:MYXO-CTERM domain-containing protein
MRRLPSLLALINVAALSACAGPPVDPAVATTRPLIANRNLDVLFMIDNSSSMRLSQTNLLNNFSTFMDVLKNLPGGLPNIHVAVVSSDMGAGDGSVAGCSATGGDNGLFQYTARGTCASTTLQNGATFISNVGGVANYTAADLSTVFSCIAALGDTGCGFEHQFASVLRALGADGQPAPAENQGFLRSDALLAIVMVTNEDDCSARPGIQLYDFNSNMNLTSALGPLSNYRCNEFGHVCDGAPPPRMAPNNDVNTTVMLQNCTSSDCDGSLVPVGEFAARIKALKAAPASEIVVAAITGPATPYTVHWKAPSIADTSCGQASCPWPEITHSCVATDSSFADPAVRVTEAVNAFGVNGFVSSICDANFGTTLQQIANRIGVLLAAGGGTGGGPGPIPSCATSGLGGAGGSTGAGGAGGGGGTGGSASGGTTGGSAPADASVDGRGTGKGGGGCQVGGGGGDVSGIALLAVMAFLWRARRRRTRARA